MVAAADVDAPARGVVASGGLGTSWAGGVAGVGAPALDDAAPDDPDVDGFGDLGGFLVDSLVGSPPGKRSLFLRIPRFMTVKRSYTWLHFLPFTCAEMPLNAVKGLRHFLFKQVKG